MIMHDVPDKVYMLQCVVSSAVDLTTRATLQTLANGVQRLANGCPWLGMCCRWLHDQHRCVAGKLGSRAIQGKQAEGHTGSQGLHALASPALTEEVVGAVLTAKVEAIHDEYRRDSLDHLDLPVLRRHRHEVTADVSSDVS